MVSKIPLSALPSQSNANRIEIDNGEQNEHEEKGKVDSGAKRCHPVEQDGDREERGEDERNMAVVGAEGDLGDNYDDGDQLVSSPGEMGVSTANLHRKYNISMTDSTATLTLHGSHHDDVDDDNNGTESIFFSPDGSLDVIDVRGDGLGTSGMGADIGRLNVQEEDGFVVGDVESDESCAVHRKRIYESIYSESELER